MEAFVHGPEELLTTTASWNPPRADPDLFLSKSISFLHTTRRPDQPQLDDTTYSRTAISATNQEPSQNQPSVHPGERS